MCKRLVAWWKWRRLIRFRRDEEFRLFVMTLQPSADTDDVRAWLELKEENRVLGVWD